MATKAEAKRNASEHQTRRAMVAGCIGLAAGFGLPGYLVVASDPSFGVGCILYGLCICSLFWAIVEGFHKWTPRAIGILILVILSVEGYKWGRGEWAKKIDDNIKANLEIEVTIPDSGDVSQSMVEIRNKSSRGLNPPIITCSAIKLRSEQTILSRVSWSKRIDAPLEPGDKVTTGCLTVGDNEVTFMTIQGNITCADIVIAIAYSTETFPNVKDEVPRRFVFGYPGEKHWVQQPVERSGSYCSP